MEQTKPYSLQSPEAIAKEYGGNKQKIARAVQMGMVDPTAATLAGMFIDRMRSAAMLEQDPNQTVTGKVFTPPQVAQAGLPAAPGAQMAPQGAPQMAPAQAQQPVMAADGGYMEMNEGLMSINVPEDMYNYGGGGIVAFAAGTPDDDDGLRVLDQYLASGKADPRVRDIDPAVFRRAYKMASPEKKAELISMLKVRMAQPDMAKAPTDFSARSLAGITPTPVQAPAVSAPAAAPAIAPDVEGGAVGIPGLIQKQAPAQAPAPNIDMTGVPNVPTGVDTALKNTKVDPRVMEAMLIAQGKAPPKQQAPAANYDYDPSLVGQPEPTGLEGSFWPRLAKDVKGAFLYSSDAEAEKQRAAEAARGPVLSEKAAVTGLPGIAELRRKAMETRAGMSPDARALYDKNVFGIAGATPSTTTAAPPVAGGANVPGVTDQAAAPAGKSSGVGRGTFAEAYGQAEGILKDKLAAIDAEDPMKDIKEELKNASATRKAELKDAAWMRLAEFGLGMAAGESPYAMVNAGKAGVQAIKGYAEDLREKKKLDREDRKLLADIKKMEHAERRGDVFKTTDLAFKVYNEMGEDARAQLQADTTRFAYGRPAAEVQSVREFAKSRGISYAQAYKEMAGARQAPKDRSTAMKEWSGDILLRKQYPNFEDYFSAIGGTLGVPGVKYLGTRPQ